MSSTAVIILHNQSNQDGIPSVHKIITRTPFKFCTNFVQSYSILHKYIYIQKDLCYRYILYMYMCRYVYLTC